MSRRSARRDSTWVNGLIQHYEAGLQGEVRGFTVNSNLTSDVRSGDSKTRQRDTAGLLVNNLVDKTRQPVAATRVRKCSGNRLSTLSATANTRWVHEINQYWDIQANNQLGGQESKDGRDVGSTGVIEWKPSESTRFRGEIGQRRDPGLLQAPEEEFPEEEPGRKVRERLQAPFLRRSPPRYRHAGFLQRR